MVTFSVIALALATPIFAAQGDGGWASAYFKAKPL
jgi:hypothetical protein